MQLIRDNLTLWTSELEEGDNWLMKITYIYAITNKNKNHSHYQIAFTFYLNKLFTLSIED
jgi:hypothetical protein